MSEETNTVGGYTVIGIWDEMVAVPIGYVIGHQQVLGPDAEEFQTWATFVDTDDTEALYNLAIEQMLEENS